MHASGGTEEYLVGIAMLKGIMSVAGRWLKFWKYFSVFGLTINRPVYKRCDISDIQILGPILKAEAFALLNGGTTRYHAPDRMYGAIHSLLGTFITVP
jgi:hypothetical protein